MNEGARNTHHNQKIAFETYRSYDSFIHSFIFS
jgi:hypothetical protein